MPPVEVEGARFQGKQGRRGRQQAPQSRPNPVARQSGKRTFAALGNTGGTMRLSVLLRRFCAILCVAALGFAEPSAFAQSGPSKPSEQKPAGNGKEAQKQIDEIAEAARLLTGPAGNPECVWLGRRVVTLLWRDDLDTAFRHLDLYDRFGCPAAHIQATFRCLVRQGHIDPKAAETLNGRVHSCWLNPARAAAGARRRQAPAAPPAPAPRRRNHAALTALIMTKYFFGVMRPPRICHVRCLLE